MKDISSDFFIFQLGIKKSNQTMQWWSGKLMGQRNLTHLFTIALCDFLFHLFFSFFNTQLRSHPERENHVYYYYFTNQIMNLT